MKQFFSFWLVAATLLIACNNKKASETVTVTSKDGKENVTIDPAKMQDAATDMAKMKEELGKLTPLTADQLKAMLPAQLMDAPPSNVDVSAAAGASVAEADYKINDTTEVKLSVIDCAGPGGAGIYSMQYLGLYNIQQDDEEEYTKTIDFNGGKAFENCKKTRAECTLTYFSGNRFLVTLEGENVGIDALKRAAKGLNIK